MKLKYLKTPKKNKDGSTTYYIEVPLYIQSELPNLVSKPFYTLNDAQAYSLEVQAKFARHKSLSKRVKTLLNGTVKGLIDHYIGSEEFHNLKDNSKRSYRMLLNNAMNLVLPGYNMSFGDMDLTRLNRGHVKDIIHLMREQKSHHQALHTIKVLRVVWSVGVRNQKVTFNPFKDPRIKSVPPREVIWTDAQVKTFIGKCDDMGLHSLGTLALMCYQMCQRPGDIRQLTWDKYHDGMFVFNQEKTGTEVLVPVAPPLQARLDKYHTQDGVILICELNGKPYDRWWYAKLTRRVRDAAGLPKELRIGDLRRTGTTRLANNNCTEDELMSVTGHKSREVVSVYVKRSKEMARNAIMKAWS
jgi:integrase